MAGRFTAQEWTKINKLLGQQSQQFGLPEGGREASLVFASFNIRKLGDAEARETELDFLARFCARCDLVAIQEVQDNLDGLRFLQHRMETHVAGDGEFGLVVSDITGEVPGERGMAERLAFLFRKRRIRQADMASDLTIDRTSVLAHFFDNEEAILTAHSVYKHQFQEFQAGRRKTRPTFAPPVFISFVRTPFVAAFEAPAANDHPPLRFTAVNAHLVYGTMQERRQEFEALVSWLSHRMTDSQRLAPNFMLLGDLNLDFDQPRKDRVRIETRMREINKEAFAHPNTRRVYFPFIDPDPHTGRFLRSNARNDETFDQIGFFLAEDEKRLPNDRWQTRAGHSGPDGYDYGVFNFADLFSRALLGKPYTQLTKQVRAALGKKFEHSVSDHMPIWVRIPRPGFAQTP
jgi:endonuclease/exonuclease/phosphatase family metal-dependent hydrolase